MSNILKKMQKNTKQDMIRKAGTNKLLQATAAAAEERARELTLHMTVDMMQHFSLAIESVFREQLGYGNKRLYKLVAMLNNSLPDHLQFTEVQRAKITNDRLWDLAEILLELNCSYKKCKVKSYNQCNLYTMMNNRLIPYYDEVQEGCPYKITPGGGYNKLTGEQIKALEWMLTDKNNRIRDGG